MRPFFGLDDFAGFGKITNLESVTTGDTKMMVVSKTETTTSHRLVVAKNAITTNRRKPMNLPYSEQLDIGRLGRFFDNTSEGYKFFWFKAILSKISEGKTEYTYEELVDEMIAEAWLWIFYFIVKLDYTINHNILPAKFSILKSIFLTLGKSLTQKVSPLVTQRWWLLQKMQQPQKVVL